MSARSFLVTVTLATTVTLLAPFAVFGYLVLKWLRKRDGNG